MPSPPIRHDPRRHLFEFDLDGCRGTLEYRISSGFLTILHTVVDPALAGRGLGGQLVEAALGYARDAGLEVASACGFASRYLQTRAS
ncbi:N-acetyltransferase [Luteimonas sp. BDR2-5]|uniref:GNAT family N-acetyltransferase n=1 Tax=Proluteimonas luteida TaxID=2878685 RepID=UPI001E3324D0|nr:GNAT family N-acetyltransferase [Luteimonas sp. BDR2-5]MCD9029634.1 N-acetyltransferase [Luteimonas sp. BDR2-5]